MRILLYLLSSCLLLACSEQSRSTSFVFYDSHGVLYKSDSAGTNAKKEYNLAKEPKLVLIATTSAKIDKFVEQMSIIYKTDAEKYQYMYVVANKEKENRSGYYTSSSDAEKLVAGNPFRIFIYNESGKLITSSTNVISSDKLKSHLTHMSPNSVNRH